MKPDRESSAGLSLLTEQDGWPVTWKGENYCNIMQGEKDRGGSLFWRGSSQKRPYAPAGCPSVQYQVRSPEVLQNFAIFPIILNPV